MSDPNGGRIAFKFTPSTTKKPTRPTPPSTLGKRPRHHALASDSDHSDDDDTYGKHEAITGFGADGTSIEQARKAQQAVKKTYVIERIANRDWKADVKANRPSRQGLPAEARQNGATKETEPADQDKPLQWGLTIKEKSTQEDDEETPAEQPPEPPKEESKPQTADEEALDALLGKKKKEERVIPQVANEDEAYQRDVDAAGAASTLEDYEAMPVEEFGAALLRGMGWDGKSTGTKAKEVKRRPNKLGLGAKELNEAEDLGGWDQDGKKKRPPRLNDYKREEAKRKEGRSREDSYKRERERERERERGGHRSDRHMIDTTTDIATETVIVTATTETDDDRLENMLDII